MRIFILATYYTKTIQKRRHRFIFRWVVRFVDSPKHLLRLVFLSINTFALITFPNGMNVSRRSLSEKSGGRWYMNKLEPSGPSLWRSWGLGWGLVPRFKPRGEVAKFCCCCCCCLAREEAKRKGDTEEEMFPLRNGRPKAGKLDYESSSA